MHEYDLSAGNDELLRPGSTGPSSIEDFWMFFAFAMIFLVFVLMNYVNYLSSLVVKAPLEERHARSMEEMVQAATIDIFVEEGASGSIIYRLDSPEGAQHEVGALQVAIEARLQGLPIDRAASISVRAPGSIAYEHVFAASHAAWRSTEQQPERQLDVHLVYEATGGKYP